MLSDLKIDLGLNGTTKKAPNNKCTGFSLNPRASAFSERIVFFSCKRLFEFFNIRKSFFKCRSSFIPLLFVKSIVIISRMDMKMKMKSMLTTGH